MPLYFDQPSQRLPGNDVSTRDLRIGLDIGGDQKVKDLRPDEQLFAAMGSAVTDTIKTGISIGSKLPLLGDAVKLVADSPVGWTIGKGLEALQLASNVVSTGGAFFRKAVTRKEDLPADIQRMINSGADEMDILSYMVKTQRAWSDSPEANLVFSLLTDPLTYTPAVLGKVGMLKPIVGVGTGVAGGVAGGATAGLMGLGPIGAVGGGIIGGVVGARKAAQFAGRAALRSSNLERVAQRAALGERAVVQTAAREAVEVIPAAVEKVPEAASLLKTVFKKLKTAEGKADAAKPGFIDEVYVESIVSQIVRAVFKTGSGYSDEVKDAVTFFAGEKNPVEEAVAAIRKSVDAGKITAEEGSARIKQVTDDAARHQAVLDAEFGPVRDQIRKAIDDALVAPEVPQVVPKSPSSFGKESEIAAFGGPLTQTERLALYLNKPRGMDLSQRLSIGRQATAEIAKAKKILEGAKDPVVIQAQKKIIANAEEAMKNANAIDDGIIYGTYSALKAITEGASGPMKYLASAFTVPAHMLMQRELGGVRLNERVARYGAGIFGDGATGAFNELVGRAIANFGMIGMQNVFLGKNTFRATNVAERIAKAYFDAKQDLRALSGRGADVQFTPQEVIEQMRTNVSAAASVGGDTGIVGMFDATNLDELTKRIEFLSSVDQQAAALTPGRGTIPQIKALANYIESEMNIGDIQAIRRANPDAPAGQAFEKTFVSQIRESGVESFHQAGVDQIKAQMVKLTFEVRNKQVARTMFEQHAKSATIALGMKWDEVADGWRRAFEERFGKFYDERGLPKNEAAIDQAAEEMLFVQSIGYSGASEVTGTVNRLFDRVQAADPTLIAEIGQESFEQLQNIFAEIGGKVNVVSKYHLFSDTATALRHVYMLVEKATPESTSRYADDEARLVTVNIEDNVSSSVARRAGSYGDVAALKRQLQKMASNPKAPSGYTKILKKLIDGLDNTNNLDDVRAMWAKTAADELDDVRAFGGTKNHKEIYEFLREAIDQGLTSKKLSDRQTARLATALRLMGYDGDFIAGLNNGAYRVALAPTNNMIYKPSFLETATAQGGRRAGMFSNKIVPFVDNTSESVMKVSKKMVPNTEYKATFLQEFGTKMFSDIPQKYITASIRRRMASYLARGGLGEEAVDAVLDDLVQRGIAQGVSARGLETTEHYTAFKNAIDRVGGVGAYDNFVQSYMRNTADGATRFDPTRAVMYAFRGDLNVIGGTQYLTGGAKVWAPWVAGYTDRIYPMLKFKLNPIYFVQEYLESPTLNAARGVDVDTLASITKDGSVSTVSAGQLRNLSDVGPETQNYLDNVNFLAVFRNDAIAQATTGRYDEVVAATGLWQNIKSGRSLGKLAQKKESYRDALALDLTAKTFSDTLRNRDFNTWSALSAHYGTTDARAIFTNYVNYRLRLGDTKRVLSDIEASRPAGVGFNRIPDPEGNVRFAAKVELITGNSRLSEELAGQFGGMNLGPEELFEYYAQNPHIWRAELDKHMISLQDAGYDMTEILPVAETLRKRIIRLEDAIKEQGYVPDDMRTFAPVAGLADASDKLGEALNRLDVQSIELIHKQSALRTLASASGMINPEAMTDLGDMVVQTLLVGKGFSTEAQNVIDAVNRSMDAAKSGGANMFTEGRAFSEAVSNAMRAEIAADPSLIKVFQENSLEIISNRSAEETVYNAFQYAYTKALEQANKTTYYASQRSFFERTINHPMLGFYPYSYMFKKILPEFYQLLFKGGFGVKAPGAGYSAYMNVRDYVEAQLEEDPSFRRALEAKPEMMYMATMLFPGVPWDLSVVPPVWARNVYKRIMTDKDITLENILIDDTLSRFSDFGPFTTVPFAMKGIGQAFEDNSPKPIRRVPSAFPSSLD
jgi:polyhydroxyalkanoate synthesis regulator phasin